MSRLVVPRLMVLRLGSLPDAVPRYVQVEQKYGSLLRRRSHDTREPGIPVSLRWVLNPVLGFPRTPFEVWRRRRVEEPTDKILGAAVPTAPSTVTLPHEVIEVRFDASPGPGGLTVEALSGNGSVLPGQRLQFATAQKGRFRAPGIAALRVGGAGSIKDIEAIVQTEWANLTDWVRIEVVGFPFDSGELPPATYDPDKQGWDAPSLTGPEAALVRLGVARLLQLDPPAPGGGSSAPSWPFPDPVRFLDVLRKLPLADVAACLNASDDTDARQLQGLQGTNRTLPGLRQPGQVPQDPAEFSMTTAAAIALAIHDGPVAVGLGFGTVDIPPSGPFAPRTDVMPPGTELGRDEYLVTARFVTPFGTQELAAIGHRAAPPPALASVAAAQTFANRSMTRDGAESVAVRLSWSAPREQVGAALLVDPSAGQPVFFNTPRPHGSGGFQPYLTEHHIAADGNPPGDLRPGVTMPEAPVPITASASTTYAVAPLDIHGRWGPWRLASHTIAPRAVQKPGLGDVLLALPSPLPPSGPVAIGCTLTVEVLWDWADRTPDRIEVSGAFVAPAGPPPVSVSGFAVASTAAPLPVAVTIGFTFAGLATIAPPPAGSAPAVVALLQNASVIEVRETGAQVGPPAGSAADQVRRYRLTVRGLSASFAQADQVGYAVSARAAERVRPASLSDEATPRATKIANPFPALPPTLPSVTVLWTAQPDAAGVARTVLSWPAVAGASGYIVWEATETALSDAVGGTAVAGTIRARAADLKSRVGASSDARLASLAAFSRLNERPLTATSIELALPGSADTLYAYRLSSITTQNMESERTTDIVLVGVPHREVPGTPRVEARPSAGATVTLMVIAGTGLLPAALRIYRVRREALADQIGTMGPAKIAVATSGLPLVPVPSLSGTVEMGWQFTDAVVAGWTPYHYRCVAVGRDIPDEGIRAGDSPASGMARVLVPPPVAPLMSGATRTNGLAGALLRFDTDLPFASTMAGDGLLTIASVVGGARTVVARFPSTSIAVGPPLELGRGRASALAASRGTSVKGVSKVSVLIPATLLPRNRNPIVITATDPLGRSTSVEVG